MNDAADRRSVWERRVQYETAGLDIEDLTSDPVDQWHVWHREATEARVAEPNAMTLASVDSVGAPDARIVLIRLADALGFTFFTNYESAKSKQLDANPAVAGVFGWLDLHRQVRIRGTIERLFDHDSDEYFASRPRSSQLGAWASPQSTTIRDRDELDQLVADAEVRFEELSVPRPPHWGGWRLVPNEFEFWQGRPSRLHDRLRYRLASGVWKIERLAP